MKPAMKIGSFLLLLVVLIVHGEDETATDDGKQCIKERRRGLVSIKKKIGLCETAVSANTLDGEAMQGCLAKCVFKHENVLDVDDVITRESFETAIENRVSGRQREFLIESFDQCLDEHGHLVVPEDPTCPGYLNLGACLQSAIDSLCEDQDALTPRPDIAHAAKDEL